MSTCPHCGARAIVEPSAALRFRCGVCGGPVVPVQGCTRRNAELGSLVIAQRARAMALGWTAAAIVLATIAAMTTGLALLLFGAAAHATGALVSAIGAAAVFLTVTAAMNARARRADTRAALDEAWEQAADDLIAARGANLTAPELAIAMRTNEAHAEVLLSKLAARGRTRVEVRDDAEPSYGTAQGAAGAALGSSCRRQ